MKNWKHMSVCPVCTFSFHGGFCQVQGEREGGCATYHYCGNNNLVLLDDTLLLWS